MNDTEDRRKWHHDCVMCDGTKRLVSWNPKTKKDEDGPCPLYRSEFTDKMEKVSSVRMRIAHALEKLHPDFVAEGNMCNQCGHCFEDGKECMVCDSPGQ